MRILSIGNFTTGWDNSICDEEHIAGALEQLGHHVDRCQRGTDIASSVGGNYDFVLLAQWEGYNDIEWLKQYGPIVYWAFDYQADGQEWHERLVREADLYLSKRIADSKYSNWQWLSQDFAPEFLYRLPQLPPVYQDIEVLFTGSYLPWATERNEFLKAVDDKFNLVIHSVNEWPGFKTVRPPVMDEGLPDLYRSAQLVLSIDHTLEAGYWSDRNAQIMCCGRRPLFRYVPLSEATFRDNVEYFYSIEDGLKKIEHRMYCEGDNPAYEFAQTNLKVTDRVKDLLTIVNAYSTI